MNPRVAAFVRKRLLSCTTAAAAIYALIAAAMYPGLLANLGGSLPNDPADPVLNTTILLWNATALPFTREWWNLPAFFPAEGVTTFSEHLTALSLVATPVIAAGGNAVLAYNVVFLTSFVFCGLAMYLLVRELTGSATAALLAGLAYAFAPYRVAQVAHIQVLVSYWMPLALLGLHRYLRTGGNGWLALAAGAWLMQGLANGYYLVSFSILIALWMLWFVVFARRWKVLLACAVAWLVAALPVAYVLLRYREVHGRYGLARTLNEIHAFSPDVLSLLSATDRLAVWGWLDVFSRPEGQLFPGLTIPLVLAFALFARRSSEDVRTLLVRRIHRLALAPGAVVAAVIVWRAAFGPIELGAFGVRLTVTSFQKPLSLLVLFVFVFAVTSHTFLRAVRTQSAMGFYLFATVVVWLLALGPEPTFAGEPVLYEAPYRWLLRLPGVNGLRVPSRIWMLAVLCLSIALGMTLTRLRARWPRAQGWALAAVGLGLVVDGVPRVPIVPAPSLPCVSAARDEVLLQLPIDMGAGDNAAMYRALHLGIPTFNGASGHPAPHYYALWYGVARRDDAFLRELSATRPVLALVDRSRPRARGFERFVSRQEGAQYLGACNGLAAYRIPASGSASASTPAPALRVPIARLTADRNEQDAPLAIDDDLLTRWHGGPQLEPSVLTAELSRPAAVDQVVLHLGRFGADFPRHLVVETSADGAEWRTVWEGPTHALAFRALVEHPSDAPLRIRFSSPTPARFVRLRQTGRDDYYWSIAELACYEGRPSLTQGLPLTVEFDSTAD